MFESVGWAEILVLIVAGLFILGPERLPEAARWLGNVVKQIHGYATGARDHLRNEFGPDFDQIQQPLNDLRGMRNINPRTAITRTLFPDDEPTMPNGNASHTTGAAGHRADASGPAAGAA